MNNNAKRLYDATAKNYDKRHNNPTTHYMRKKELDLIRKYVKGLTLDIGCGTGEHLHLIKNGSGLDISYNMLKEARKKSNLPLIQGDIEKLPIKGESFDSVICIFTILNLCDFRAAIKEMKRILKPNGIAIVSVAARWKEKSSLSERLRHEPKEITTNIRIEGLRLKVFSIGKRLLIKSFEQNGFELLEFHGIFKLQKPYWGCYRDFTALEKLKLKIFDHVLPSRAGRIYFGVFKKIEDV